MQAAENQFSYLDVQQKLLLAVYTLVIGQGSLQQRLLRVWKENLADIGVNDFPEYLREAFSEVRADLQRFASRTIDLSKAPEAAALEGVPQELASKVFILSELTTELFNVEYYRYSLTAGV